MPGDRERGHRGQCRGDDRDGCARRGAEQEPARPGEQLAREEGARQGGREGDEEHGSPGPRAVHYVAHVLG